MTNEVDDWFAERQHPLTCRVANGQRLAGCHAKRAFANAHEDIATDPGGRSGVDLPTSEALAQHQFVVPRGRNDATQLNLASVSGAVPPRTLNCSNVRQSPARLRLR